MHRVILPLMANCQASTLVFLQGLRNDTRMIKMLTWSVKFIA